jgi:hypothetical protein
MQTDRTTKALLALIAIGLFLNVFVPLLQGSVVNAQSRQYTPIEMLEAHAFNIFGVLQQIAVGTCLNEDICKAGL